MAVVLAVIMGVSGVGFVSVLWMRITLSDASLQVTHTFWRTRAIPLSSIAGAQPTSSGIQITLVGSRQVVAGAVQVSNLRSWIGSSGRAARIAGEIVAAARKEGQDETGAT